MSRHVFTTKPGITRVQAGADPRIEITAGKPYTTSDPGLAAELRANPFLNHKTAAASTATKKPASPKRKAAAAAAPPAGASDGGAS